jgi:prepilin-type N-terminal cleavage/methylation domain-containing protein
MFVPRSRRLRHAFRKGCPEDGFTILELVVALSLIAIVAIGFTTTIGASFRGILIARQRQSAAQIASARLEEARYDPYAQLALPTTLVQSSDPTNPDSFVSSNGSQFDVTGTGQYEDLVYDPAGVGDHFQDPVQVGAIFMKVFEYVTWVSDGTAGGTHAYKRVTIVVQYHTPAANGVNKMVRLSSFFTPGSVTFPAPTTVATTTTTTVPSTTTTTAPSGSPTTVPGSCSGVQVNGSMAIGTPSGAVSGFSPSDNLTLNLVVNGSCNPLRARFSNDGATWGAWVTYTGGTQQVAWSVSSGDGLKTVYGQVGDSTGAVANMTSQSVTLDQTPPTSPGTLTYVASCQGSNRTVSLGWLASSDTNFQGYRVYRSTDGGVSWQAIATTSVQSYSDTTAKSIASTQYKVVGYDQAGNESNATNVVSFAKNQCS